MLSNKQKKMNLFIVLMAAAVVVAGAGVATAEVSYHLVRFPDIRFGVISDSGVILAGSILVEPARDAAGNPVWDLDGDGIVDGYTVTTLEPGAYQGTGGRSINEFLDVVGSGTDKNGDRVVLLWLNAPDGSPPVELGRTFTDAELETFTAHRIYALSINDLGQVLVFESGDDESDPDFFKWTGAFALAVVNPKDTDFDGLPDTWFEDVDEDGANDLMLNLKQGTGWDVSGRGSINNRGEVAAVLNLTSRRGFVVVPMDTDGDGEPDVWFEDLDGDGWNDLERDLGPNIDTVTLSDSGVVVGTEIVWGKGDHYLRWQIDESGNVELVAEKRGACFMTGVNNLGQAVGYTMKYMGNMFDKIEWTTHLWEPDLRIINLLNLLDNPKTAQSLHGLDISNTGYIVGLVRDNYPQDTDAFVAVPLSHNAPPEVFISSPLDGDAFDSGATINFSGTASDPEDGDLTSSMVWTSNIDGQIGTGGSFSTPLSDGIHTIMASATDYEGKTGSDSISITVGTPAPEVTVDSITPNTMQAGTSIDVTITGSGFQAGATVTFENGWGPAPAANVTSVSVNGTTIEATVTIHKKAKLGVLWDVRVTNPDGSSDVLVGGFTVAP